MTHGVDAHMDSMKTSGPNSLVDCAFAPAAVDELPAPHHSVLPPRKRREIPVVIASP